MSTVVRHSPLRTDDLPGNKAHRAGGIITIIALEWGLSGVQGSTDPGKLGIVLSTTIEYGEGTLEIQSVYWPIGVSFYGKVYCL